jgi:hypothetical protein
MAFYGLVQLTELGHLSTCVMRYLSQICLELNYLIVHLEPECTPEVCPEMRAEEWKYYCATHPTPREVTLDAHVS